ncbi:hypothetical protein IAD21_00402 [Abditibacteriota bacterium]|nr:hypothetical protein IAD21_00402 [Abditibacteriota bacterium]
MSSSFCYAELPQAGLGNRLLVWGRALLFARMNGLPLLVSSWQGKSWWRRLSGNADQRRYNGYFTDTDSLRGLQRWRILRTSSRVVEPPLQKLPSGFRQQGTLYVFNELPHWSDYFGDLRADRNTIKAELSAMLTAPYREQLAKLTPPVIGIHVRLGDFRPLREGEDFAKVGHVRTPLDYFRHIIEGVREVHGSILPVTIFSDGSDEELRPLTDLPDVHRSGQNSAIIDLLLLAQSRLVVASPGSTFSGWAGFLADAPFLLHPDHVHAPIRPDEVNNRFFEGGVTGPISSWSSLLLRNIREIEA